MKPQDNYHDKAQAFIKSSKDKGYSVKAEGEELIAIPPKNNKSKVASALNRIKDKVVDVASDVMSAPARIKSKMDQQAADSKYQEYKMLNDSKGKPDAGNETDPLFRARINAIHDTFDREQAKRDGVRPAPAVMKVGKKIIK